MRFQKLALVLGLWLGSLPTAAFAQDDGPLADNPLFEKDNGLGGAVVMWSDNNTGLHDKAFDFVPPDAGGLNAGLLPQTRGNLEPDAQTTGFFFHRPLELITVDFDGDGFDEYVAAWERANRKLRLRIPQDLARTGPSDGATGLPTLEWTVPFDIDIQDLDFPGTSTPLPDQMANDDFERLHIVAMAPGDFDADGLPELAVAYWADDGSIQILLFDSGGSKQPLLVAAIADEFLPPLTPRAPGAGLAIDDSATRSSKFDIVAGDFDDDGKDDLGLVWIEGSGSVWELRAKAYDYDPASMTLAEATAHNVFYSSQNTTKHIESMDVTAGNFDAATTGDEMAIGYNLDLSGVGADGRGENYLQLVRVNLETSQVFGFGTRTLHTDPDDFLHTLGPGQQCTPSNQSLPPDTCWRSTEGYPVTVAGADVDGDGDDEVLMMAFEHMKLYQEPTAFNTPANLIDSIALPVHANLSTEVQLRSVIDVKDLDPDVDGAVGMPEVGFLVEDLSTGDRGFLLQIYELIEQPSGSFEFSLLAERLDEASDAFVSMSYALALGSFNGPDVRLGTPQRSSVTDIAQPLVVLSASPVHFDRIGAENFDLNLCYPSSFGPPPDRQSCEFVSSYEKSTETTLSLTAEFHSDWSLSAGIESEVSFFGTTVEGSLMGTVGEGFSRVESERQTQTISVEQRADIDDWLYAATFTYDVWEYPVYAGGEVDPRGYLAVVRPRLSGAGGLQLRWFNSKSYLAQSFLPPHEVGNILSYREIAAPEDASGFAEEVRFATSDARTLSISGGGSWSLGFAETTATTTSRSNRLSIEAAASIEGKAEFPIEGFDPGGARLKVSVAGTYNQESISTTELSFNESVAINFDFTSLDPSIGDTNYDVTPYVYWAKNGALVLDYAAAPEIAPPSSPMTWWTQQYGSEPDPTFILPWKHDPEKGIALTDESRREQTRDIRIEPADAAAGDNVTIFARVSNFSLLPSPSVRVSFFFGDPDEAGAIFIGERTTNPIQPRDRDIIEIDWTLPMTAVETARIYAVLDPLGEIAEVHEANNKAWSAIALAVPEPGSGLAAVTAIAALAFVRSRRARGDRRSAA